MLAVAIGKEKKTLPTSSPNLNTIRYSFIFNLMGMKTSGSSGANRRGTALMVLAEGQEPGDEGNAHMPPLTREIPTAILTAALAPRNSKSVPPDLDHSRRAEWQADDEQGRPE